MKSLVQGMLPQVLRLCFLLSCLLLTGCGKGGSAQTVDFGRGYETGLVYAMPYGGQDNVPTGSRVTLKFTDPIQAPLNSSAINLTRLSTGERASGTVTQSEADPTILYFQPENPLYSGDTYQVGVEELQTPAGPIENQKSLYSFRTLDEQGDEFQLLRHMPSGQFPFMDFSTINLTFSKALRDHSVILGDSIHFIDESNGQAVAAGLYVQGTNITLDPLNDLVPGHNYRLTLGATIKSVAGDNLPSQELIFTPQSSLPRGNLDMRMTQPNIPLEDPDYPKSSLNSAPINTVRFASQLLGGQNVIPLSGTITAELAHLPNYPQVSPMIIRKGLVFTGQGFDVLVGGNIPVAIHSGDIRMTLLSDAQGYMVKSIFSDYRYASNNVYLYMDVAIEATNPTVQGMVTQDVLHAELIGTIVAENGKMIFDASGMIENDVMRIGTATSEISFHLESVEGGKGLEVRKPTSAEPLRVVSTYPAFGDGALSPDNDIALYFSSVIEETTFVAGENVRLTMFPAGQGAPQQVDFDISVEGAVLYLKPKTPLPFGATYTVDIGRSVTDKSRNSLAADISLQFETQSFSEDDPRPAIVKNAYPGYACAMTEVDYAQQITGRCLGGKKTDDKFKFFTMPANRSIEIRFTQPMDTRTLWMGEECNKGSFRVEIIDNTGECTGVVAGDLMVKNQRLVFTPDRPWQKDQTYRYILMSSDADEICDDEEICSLGNPPLPLNTDPLNYKPGVLGKGVHGDIGGPPLEIQFIGQAPTRYVFAPLELNPFVDVNGNGLVDDDEERTEKNFFAMQNVGLHGMVQDLSIGCSLAEKDTCPEEKLRIYNNGSIYSEIKNPTAARDAVLVDVLPNPFYGTSIKLNAKAFGGLIKLGMDTGVLIFRTRQVDGNPMPARFLAGGYNEAGKALPAIFESEMKMYVDAPYLQVLEGLSGTNMHSLPVDLKLRGPVTFQGDGRMVLDLTNPEPVKMTIDLYLLERQAIETLLGKNGFAAALDVILKFFTLSPDHKIGAIDFEVPVDGVKLYFVGEALQ